ncbi:MAG: methylthioribulose 1-phosphate dehydratase [Bacteroidetes bacterium]|nr:methylthioribulose 1-phosphate dehydratase [Bacteroidota bacterium]
MHTDLISAIQYLHSKGWAPATSSNYSMRDARSPGHLWISRSGVDKRHFREADLVCTDAQGVPLADPTIRTSAETALHTLIYAVYPQVQCVLHTHTVANTVAGLKYPGGISFQGLEMQKAIEGNSTHEEPLNLPVYANTQDIAALAREIKPYLEQNAGCYGFLIAGHGLYAWGDSVAQAARHIEAWEFLLETRLLLEIHGIRTHS